jgi:16S rRNA (adenine1518-N6/adenine1519-N6)-dimethyltransferase
MPGTTYGFEMHIRPKKGLGQHFLIDKNIARKIVQSLADGGFDTIYEIGPGTGILTEILIDQRKEHLFHVEIDIEAVEFLRNQYPERNDNILHQDFLKFDFPGNRKSDIAIIGNFPYNISSQIFFRILENRSRVVEVVGMIQKEVAQRIASQAGSRTYGILSVLLQAYYDIDLLFSVGRQVFRPRPNVDSAVIRLRRNSINVLACDEDLFFRVIKTGFNQRRKTLRNSLKSILLNLQFQHNLLDKRPEQLSVKDFIELTGQIEQAMSNSI